MIAQKYLLDTNIWIYFMKGMYNLREKIESVGSSNCYVSIITVGELLYGAANSQKVTENTQKVNTLLAGVEVVSVDQAMAIYALQKAHLKSIGRPVADFDLLIGATAIAHQMTLVTKNTKDFINLMGLQLEDWTSDQG